MMTVLAIVWIVSVWMLLLVALALVSTVPLMRRRDPDPPDDPANYELPREAVTFPSRDGLALGGWWIPVPDAQILKGTVVVCPGQNGSMDQDVPQAVALVRAGFNVLMFDFRGHGCSEGNTVTIGALEQADLFGALDYLETERGITGVGVLGLSMGAGVALMVAAQDRRIAALVVDGAYPTLGDILAGYLRERHVPGPLARGLAQIVLLAGSLRTGYQIYRANPADVAAQITAPTLFVHGDCDPFVTSEQVTALCAEIDAPTELWRVPAASHREAYTQHPDVYNARVAAWFERFLPGNS